MKHFFYSLRCTAFLFCFTLSLSLVAQLEIPQASPKSKVVQTVGVSTITVNYSRPQVISNDNDRTGKIWGQLVPWEMTLNNFTGRSYPWRAGANENTVISFSHDAKINGTAIPAGSYGFHIIPHEDGKATLIFNTEDYHWGSFQYSEEADALRVVVNTEETDFRNMLTFDFPEVNSDTVLCQLNWEHKSFPFKVAFETKPNTITSIKEQLGQTLGFTQSTYVQAANYCLTNDYKLDQGLTWADRGILNSGGTFQLFRVKADILRKMEKVAEADKIMDQALEIATVRDVHSYASSLVSKDAERAMKAFTLNYERMDQFKHLSEVDRFTVVAGMAVGYRGLKNKEKALEFAHKAQEVAPANFKGALTGFIQSLESL